jgi:3-oxoacyl-[acyl-carrier protein] reductase
MTNATENEQSGRPVALVTEVGRTAGIGAGIARGLAAAGWDIGFTYWRAYDVRTGRGPEAGATTAIKQALEDSGAASVAIEADLATTTAPGEVFDTAQQALGDVTALVMCHCESVDSGLLDTVTSFDRHFAVNARATWLLIREFALRFRGPARQRPHYQLD